MEQKKRRQFLADALFAGGSLAAAALLARGFVQPAPASTPTPSATPSASPSSCPTPEGPFPGEMVSEPMVEGKVAPAPVRTAFPAVEGDAK